MDRLKQSLEESKDIHFYDILAIFIYRNKIFISTVLCTFATIFFLQSLKPKIYQATTTIVVASEASQEGPKSLSSLLTDKSDSFDEYFFKTQYEIIFSSKVLDKAMLKVNETIDHMKLLGEHKDSVFKKIKDPQEFRKYSKVETNHETDIITFRANHQIPLMAKIISTVHAQMFIEFDYESRYQTEENIAKNLEGKLETVKVILNKSLQKLILFKKKNDNLTLSGSSSDNILFQKHDKLSHELNKTVSEKIIAESAYNYYRSKPYTTIINTLSYQKIMELLFQSREKKAAMKMKFGPRHPKMIELETQIQQINENLKLEFQTYVNSLKTKLGAIKSLEVSIRTSIKKLRDQIFSQTTKSSEHNKITREVETNQKIYQIMLKSTKEAQLKKLMVRPNFKVLDDAGIPLTPTSIAKNVPISIALAFVIGVLIVFIVEYLDTSIKTPDAIRDEVGLPLFGTLPNREDEFSSVAIRKSTLQKIKDKYKNYAA